MTTQLPVEWKQFINKEELEYLDLLINPEFITIEGLIIIKAHYDAEKFIGSWQAIIRENPNEIQKIENTINHVHLGDFTDDLELQKKIGEYIKNVWIDKLKIQFPKTSFLIRSTKDLDEWELELYQESI